MKKTTASEAGNRKALGLAFCIGALPLLGILVASCHSDKNYEQTQGQYLDSQGLSYNVKRELQADSLYKYDNVTVTTFKDTVQLGGFVSVKEQKVRAEDLARRVDGVKDVRNNITVKE